MSRLRRRVAGALEQEAVDAGRADDDNTVHRARGRVTPARHQDRVHRPVSAFAVVEVEYGTATATFSGRDGAVCVGRSQ